MDMESKGTLKKTTYNLHLTAIERSTGTVSVKTHTMWSPRCSQRATAMQTNVKNEMSNFAQIRFLT